MRQAETNETGVVVCSILERSAVAAERSLGRVPDGCGLVELRGDHLRATEIAGIVTRSARPVIVTIRPVAHGGGFDGSEEERGRALSAALTAGARFVDVELGTPPAALAEGEQAARVILSHHGGACTQRELHAVFDRMAAVQAARLKIVPCGGAPVEAGVVRELLDRARRERRRLACFASGRAGTVTRVMALAWGSWGTYGALEAGAETAEGQLTAGDLLELYDVGAIGAATQLHALVGNAVRRSPSPAMHCAAYRSGGLDARYLPVEVDELDDALALVGPGGVLPAAALAVTIPFKQRAHARCASLDEAARASGAVNTVVFGEEGWAGFDTDGPAVLSRIREHVEPRGSAVAIVGAGGTARAAAAALGAAGARVRLFNRTPARAREAARELGVEAAALDELPAAAWEVLIQATPVGTHGERVLDAEHLRGRLVVDFVYRSESPLLRDARRRGIATIDGLELLLAQAVLQFERMTGRRPEPSAMARAGGAWLAQQQASRLP